MSGEHANVKTYRLFLDMKTQEKDSILACRYLHFWGYNGSKVAIDENYDLTGWVIDVWHSGNDRYTFNLFHRKDAIGANTFGDLPSNFCLVRNGDCYEKKDLKKEEVKELVFNIIEQL